MVSWRFRFQSFIYRTRGLWLLLALLATLHLKAVAGIRVGLPLYLVSLSIAFVAQGCRTWAAGFVGTTAHERAVQGEVLITAGPYAHVRNPMYLSILIIMVAFCLMSGLWFSPIIILAAYAFVYSNVIPYEETYLSQRFKAEYDEYRSQVPRLLPTLRPCSHRQGVFKLREGLLNEAFAIPVLLILAGLFYFV